MKKFISILLIMVLVLSLSSTVFAGSDTDTVATSGGKGGSVNVDFTLRCTYSRNASQDNYTLTGTVSSTGNETLYYYHSDILSTAKTGAITTSSTASTSGLVHSKTWTGGTGWTGTMYSSTTTMRAFNDSAYGTTRVVELSAVY